MKVVGYILVLVAVAGIEPARDLLTGGKHD